jgi:hypothetical protein
MSQPTNTPPDRLSNDPSSPYYDEALLARGVGIRFKGVEKNNVEEYCVSEGWVRVAAGAARDRRGNPLTLKLRTWSGAPRWPRRPVSRRSSRGS